MTTFLRVLGIVLFVPAIFLGLIPVVVAYTSIGEQWPNWSVFYNHFQIIDFTHAPDGTTLATTTYWVWAVAAVGELMLIVAWVKRAGRRNLNFSH